MRVTRSKRWLPRHAIRFERTTMTEARSPAPAGTLRGLRSPALMVLDCPRTRASRTFEYCVRCEFFVNFRPLPEPRGLGLSCRCSDAEPILRSAQKRRSWPTVAPGTPIHVARQLARAQELPVLLVVHRRKVQGVVYREDLDGSEAPVSTKLVDYPWSVSTHATLGAAVEALRLSRAPALLVLAPDGELAGVVWTAQLLHMGVPLELLVG